MKLKTIQKEFHQRLGPVCDNKEVDNFFFMALDHFFDIKRISLALDPNLSISNSKAKTVLKVLEELETERPIQYILGETEFCGITFKVNPSVLIPRPETEELVEWVLKDSPDTKPQYILDIGTGSGCIAIALSRKLYNAKVYGMDISEEALETAKQNAALNNVHIKFVHANILEVPTKDWNRVFNNLKFDIIVSNPPYVRTLEKEDMKNNVLKHEPHLALFVEDNDALLFYRKIAQIAQNILTPKGELYFEINEYLGELVEQLLRDEGFVDVKLKTDIFNKNRMVKGTRS